MIIHQLFLILGIFESEVKHVFQGSGVIDAHL